jgi:hypothetical protein
LQIIANLVEAPISSSVPKGHFPVTIKVSTFGHSAPPRSHPEGEIEVYSDNDTTTSPLTQTSVTFHRNQAAAIPGSDSLHNMASNRSSQNRGVASRVKEGKKDKINDVDDVPSPASQVEVAKVAACPTASRVEEGKADKIDDVDDVPPPASQVEVAKVAAHQATSRVEESKADKINDIDDVPPPASHNKATGDALRLKDTPRAGHDKANSVPSLQNAPLPAGNNEEPGVTSNQQARPSASQAKCRIEKTKKVTWAASFQTAPSPTSNNKEHGVVSNQKAPLPARHVKEDKPGIPTNLMVPSPASHATGNAARTKAPLPACQ